MKQPFQPFSIEFKPLLDEIMEREKALRELANGAAMVEILGKRPYFVIARQVGRLVSYRMWLLPVPRYTGKPVS